MKTKSKISRFLGRLENATVVRAIRNGLIHIIPVLITGAFALILREFPVEAYSNFIKTFLGGALYTVFDITFGATFNALSVYMTYSISRAYMKLRADTDTVHGGAIVASLISFFVLAGAHLEDFGTSAMGPKSMFLAIITGLGASALYLRFTRFLQKRRSSLFLIGADREFNRMLSTLFPTLAVVMIFVIITLLINRVFDVSSFRELLANVFNWLFSHGETGFFKGFFFVMLSSVLWFFGIHGSDTLEGVMENFITPGLQANMDAVAAGAEPTSVLTKQLFDCFVLMGGCGATICLLIAILAFSKNKTRRSHGLISAFPMIFNINELMVFGLPIVFNPIMLVPFLVTPLVCYSVAYFAISSGLVPMITHEVAWTTPIILGGYQATGSVSGAILQVVNVIIGVLIYTPFVRMLDKHTEENAKNNYEVFIDYFKKNEQALNSVRLAEMSTQFGNYARDLTNDLKYSMTKQLKLAYQPQYDYNGNCIGVEALLRWRHPLLGVIYPPLVIKLAEDGGFLAELEETIIKKTVVEQPAVCAKFGENVKLSVNVTGTTIVTPRFIQFCRDLNEEHALFGKNICLEVTEKATIAFDDENTLEALRSLANMGFMLAIDDFSMGQTSIRYLSDNLFNIIKLDGSLVSGMFNHQNAQDIISSIIQLAKNLNLTVIAEFVDTEEKREMLHKLGCDCYQGWLYSPAVFLDEPKKDR